MLGVEWPPTEEGGPPSPEEPASVCDCPCGVSLAGGGRAGAPGGGGGRVGRGLGRSGPPGGGQCSTWSSSYFSQKRLVKGKQVRYSIQGQWMG